MSRRKKGLTLAEHHALLKAEGRWDAFLERRRNQEAELQKRREALRVAEIPLVTALKAAGHDVTSVWDLVNRLNDYDDALELLLAHLARPYPAPVREGIARAMAVPAARYAWRDLASLYRDEPDRRVKDGLACALAASCDETTLDGLIELARDRNGGPSRLLLLSSLEAFLESTRDGNAEAAER